jgi:hypothetical protein
MSGPIHRGSDISTVDRSIDADTDGCAAGVDHCACHTRYAAKLVGYRACALAAAPVRNDEGGAADERAGRVLHHLVASTKRGPSEEPGPAGASLAPV